MEPEQTYEQYVAEMTDKQVRLLKENESEKGGPGAWLDGNPTEWVSEARGHLDLLEQSFIDGTPEEVQRRGANACNFIMMAVGAEMAAR